MPPLGLFQDHFRRLALHLLDLGRRRPPAARGKLRLLISFHELLELFFRQRARELREWDKRPHEAPPRVHLIIGGPEGAGFLAVCGFLGKALPPSLKSAEGRDDARNGDTGDKAADPNLWVMTQPPDQINGAIAHLGPIYLAVDF